MEAEMRGGLVVGALVMAWSAGHGLAQDTASEAPIRAIVAAQAAAWDAGDGNAYAATLRPRRRSPTCSAW